jgi:hypothetical protein
MPDGTTYTALEKHIPVRLDRNNAIGLGILWHGGYSVTRHDYSHLAAVHVVFTTEGE